MVEKEVIKLQNVTKIFNMGEIKFTALDKINLTVNKGDYVSIMGPSGSGKTTLLDIMSTMLSPTHGQVLLNGQDTTKMSNPELAKFRGITIGFIFQTFNLLPKLSTLENVMVPMWINNYPREKRIARAKAVLESVELGDKFENRPNQLSGGQRQRVAIARALALDPDVIFADEPTGNLDSKSGTLVMEIINKLYKEEGKAIVVVTHDENIGKKAKSRIFLKDGQIVKNND